MAERILIIDDEPGVRTALAGILEDEGFEVGTAESGEAGLERLAEGAWDALFLDVWLPGIDGLVTLERIRASGSDVAVVMISGHGTIETAVRATREGAFDFIEKPLSLERTLLVLRNALTRRKLERRNRQLVRHLARESEVVGSSDAARRLRRAIEVAVSSRAPVLVCGEPGSGRETVARQIHAGGACSEGPFVELSGSARAESRDAAALEARFERARGGVLYLDDAERLRADLQRGLAALLDAPTEGLPVRGILAVGPDPALEPELMRVVDGVRVLVLPLRERREDIPAFAERMIRNLAREYGLPPKRLTPDALRALAEHDWPGNVRELQNLAERVLLSVEGEAIDAADLPRATDHRGGSRALAALDRDFGSLAEAVRAFERYHAARVLAETRDAAVAAERLGIDREALRRLVE